MRIAGIMISALLICAGNAAAASTAVQEALCTAAKSGTPDDIAAAIKNGAKAEAICDSIAERALDAAINVARVDNMEALIKAGAKAARQEHMPLAYVRNAASAELLLKHGADANAVDDLGTTPLLHVTSTLASNFPKFYQMTEQDAVDVAKVLIANGAKVNFADEFGGTALIEASFACLPKLVTLLIDKGAEVNARSSGQTGLGRLRNIKNMHPKECGETEQVLLAHGATE